MSTFTNNTFVGQRINLDDNEFDGNRFENCTLIYGGGPLSFSNNHLNNVNWEFVDAASRTIAILGVLYNTKGISKNFIEELLGDEQTWALKKEGENE